MKITLNKNEKNLENALAQNEFVSVADLEDTKELFKEALNNHKKLQKSSNKFTLKLVKRRDAIPGYKMSDIEKALGSEKFKEFNKWMNGQTVGIYKKESLVYYYDFERFLAGLRPLD